MEAGGGWGSRGTQTCGWPRNAGGKRSAVWGAVPSSVGIRMRTAWPPGRGGRLQPHIGEGVSLRFAGAKGSSRVESPRRGHFRRASSWEPIGGQAGDLAPFSWREASASSFAAAPVSPPGFSELAEPPPARPSLSEPVFAHRRAGVAEPFLPHCESRNELEASRACMLLLVL